MVRWSEKLTVTTHDGDGRTYQRAVFTISSCLILERARAALRAGFRTGGRESTATTLIAVGALVRSLLGSVVVCGAQLTIGQLVVLLKVQCVVFQISTCGTTAHTRRQGYTHLLIRGSMTVFNDSLFREKYLANSLTNHYTRSLCHSHSRSVPIRKSHTRRSTWRLLPWNTSPLRRGHRW